MVTVHVKKVVKYRVNIIESESGWGSRVDETKDFDTPGEAMGFTKEYNARYNNAERTPDWYMVAQYVGETIVEELPRSPLFMSDWYPFSLYARLHWQLREILAYGREFHALMRSLLVEPGREEQAIKIYKHSVLLLMRHESLYTGYRVLARNSAGLMPPIYREDQLPGKVPSPALIALFTDETIGDLTNLLSNSLDSKLMAADRGNVDINWSEIQDLAYRLLLPRMERPDAKSRLKNLVQFKLPGWPEPDTHHLTSAMSYACVIRLTTYFPWSGHVELGTSRQPDDQHDGQDVSAQSATDS